MNKGQYGLLDMLQYADEQMVYEAGQPWKKRKKKVWDSSGMRAACVLLAAVVGVIGVFHEQAIAAINTISSYLSEYLGNDKDLSPYTEVLSQTQTDNGISMALQEVVMDSNRMLVSVDTAFSSDAPKSEEEYERLWAYIGSVWIDGKYMDSLMAVGSETYESGQYVMEYSFADGEVPDSMSEVRFSAYLANTDADGMSESVAEFTFSFAATKEQLQAKKTVIPLDVDMDTGDGITFHMEDIAYTDVGSRIRVGCSADPRIWQGEGEERYYDIPYSFQIEDDQNHIMYYDLVGNYYDEEEVKEILYDSNGGTPPDSGTKYLKIRLYKNELVKAAGLGIDEGEKIEFLNMPKQIGKEIRVDLS